MTLFNPRVFMVLKWKFKKKKHVDLGLKKGLYTRGSKKFRAQRESSTIHAERGQPRSITSFLVDDVLW